jgi:uncharacterized protein (DUF885 family)
MFLTAIGASGPLSSGVTGFYRTSLSSIILPMQSDEALHQLFESEWEYQMEQHPAWASNLGDRRWNNRWTDMSLAAIEQRYARDKQTLQQLHSIPRDQLTPTNQLNYDLFARELENSIEEHTQKLYLIPLTHSSGIQTSDKLAETLRFTTLQDYEDWLERMQAFPVYMEQTITLMREGIRERRVQPKVIMERVPAQIEKQLVSQPEDSPFFKPFRQVVKTLSTADAERVTHEASKVIRQSILPAFEQFKRFFLNEYLPACFDEVGIRQSPGGEEAYAFLVRKYTTTRMTPQEVHETGLQEVQRIRKEMEAIIRQTGFQGDFHEFLHFLRTDPQFYYNTSGELLSAYRAMSKQVDFRLPHIFSLRSLPRMPYGVEPIPDSIAPDTTTAYYMPPAADGSRAGTYYVNLYKPETRPKYEMMALSLHEAVPGHHQQIALTAEIEGMPKFRRYGGYSSYAAYMEGWALYSEALGDDMGLYEDPYSKFGQLTYEMWRAIRLVVDPGLHVLGWTRERAIDFFLEHAAKTEHDVVNEIDRYISWPGQAVSYKIGELKIKALRAYAERELGDRFDLRAFHDVVLLEGALPLEVLEERVKEWISTHARS